MAGSGYSGAVRLFATLLSRRNDGLIIPSECRRRAWRWQCLVLGLVMAFHAPAAATQTDTLVWRVAEDKVDADIEGWPLRKLLERVSAQTRWQIHLEPGTQRVVSAKFKALKPGEALRRLLGNLSFVFVPSTNRPARLFVFHTSLQTATDIVASPPDDSDDLGPRVIRDEVLLRLKPETTARLGDLASRVGGEVIGQIDELQAYRLKFKDASAADAARDVLRTESDVGSLEANYATPRPDRPETLTMDSALQAFTLRPRTDGEQTIVGLIDTAVQTEGTVLGGFVLPTVSVAGVSTLPTDTPLHGSTMAETILYTLARSPDSDMGTAVRILPIDVYGGAESTTTFDIARGIAAAVNGGASIVNLSLGGTGESPLIHGLIQSARERGVVFVAAAGNDASSTPTYPAAYPEVIAVTATAAGGQIASYANRGGFVDVAAPGTSLVPFAGQTYLVVGTSTATANVSALAAGFMSATGKSGAEVEARIRRTLALDANAGGP